MPTSTSFLTLQSARDLIRERSFPETTTNRVGVELEWFTTPSANPPSTAALDALLQPFTPLPCGSAITFEPGAQVELSSLPLPDCGQAITSIATDTDVVRNALAARGIGLFATGVDPDRSLQLRTDAERYVTMRAYFDHYGVRGGRMMCATASIHLNLDAGSDDEGRLRWLAAHLTGPMLIAAFANSPRAEGEITGWKSSRYDAWRSIDPGRTSPVDHHGDPADAWASYALSAQVMFIRTGLGGPGVSPGGEQCHAVDEALTLAEWVAEGHPLGYPDAGDIEYHLTTLFPPVRPRGYLELRMIDMLPDPWWRAAVALSTAIVCDPQTRSAALTACEPTEGMWEVAARCALEDAALNQSANETFDVALGALHRIGCDSETVSAAHEYVDRFTSQARTPADEQLEPHNVVEAI
jgi:glutamate--cysteine ligase